MKKEFISLGEYNSLKNFEKEKYPEISNFLSSFHEKSWKPVKDSFDLVNYHVELSHNADIKINSAIYGLIYKGDRDHSEEWMDFFEDILASKILFIDAFSQNKKVENLREHLFKNFRKEFHFEFAENTKKEKENTKKLYKILSKE